MVRHLGILELKILSLAFNRGGTFDERDIADSELSDLRVGKILDTLASLKDRSMIQLNTNGTFTATDTAKEILWSNAVPTWAKILRLLQIRSCSINDFRDILCIDLNTLDNSLTKMRKEQLILMTPQRRNDKLVKIYEILPEGIEVIDKTDTGKIDEQGSDIIHRLEIREIIDNIRDTIKTSQMNDIERADILEKIDTLKSKLEI